MLPAASLLLPMLLSLISVPAGGALSSPSPTGSSSTSSSFPPPNNKDEPYDVVIIGGGVVGLAVARAATLQGYRTAVLEREPHLLFWASGTNSGIACTGADAAPGTLERALIRDAVSQLPAFLQATNIPHDKCGSLVCHWPWDAENRLSEVLQESHQAGDTHAKILDAAQVLEKEPALNNTVRGAVHIPGEIVVDPWLYSISLAVQARANGCQIYTNTAVEQDKMQWDGQLWTIPVITKDTTPVIIRTKSVVCATGAWAAEWENKLQIGQCGDKLEPAPRRGQYRIYQAAPSNSLRHPIQPIPTQFTKGIFVFSSLYNQIIVGPTAVDQESKTDRSIDPAVAAELDQHAKRILPQLNVERDLVGEYVGIRPGTNQRDYQIRTHFGRSWVTIAGIRSTGLTASLGIGRHVTHLVKQILRDASVVPQPLSEPMLPALPPLEDLIREFQQSDNGCVTIDGHVYKVAHPITRLGWKNYRLK